MFFVIGQFPFLQTPPSLDPFLDFSDREVNFRNWNSPWFFFLLGLLLVFLRSALVMSPVLLPSSLSHFFFAAPPPGRPSLLSPVSPY